MDIKKLCDGRVAVFDGALGTELQKDGLGVGEIPECVNFTNPDAVASIHRRYVEAGCDVVYTNTFGANRYKLSRSGRTVDEVVERALSLARSSGAAAVALDIGPLGRLIEPLGDLSFEEAYDAFLEIISAGVRYGADLIVIETMSDLYEVKAALLAAKENCDLPVICSMSFENDSRTFTGCGAVEAAVSLSALGADAVGVNCSAGPDSLFETAKTLLEYSDVPILVKPNAGLPDPVTGEYSLGPAEFAKLMKKYADAGVHMLGGCCGTTPEHIRLLKNEVLNFAAVPAVNDTLTICSSTKSVVCDRPVIIGERINPTGKRLLKEALTKGDDEYILSLAAEQAASGADVLDINVGLPGIDEKETMVRIVKAVQGVCDLPVQIDSSDPAVIEAALRVCRGKAIVNSVNGTEKSLSTVLPIVKKYGAAVIGLALDDDGIPSDVNGRFRAAEKIVSRALSLGIPKRDIIIDCLTLTVSADSKAPRVTLDALRRVKSELGVKTALGVSNVSFGLPERDIVSRTFLAAALEAGLDFAIINPNAPYMTSTVKAFDLLNGNDPSAEKYIEYSTGADIEANGAAQPKITLEDAVKGGMRSECVSLTRSCLETMEPLDVINSKLIPILDDVGEKYEKGTLFLPQLILAADTVGVCFSVVKEAMAKHGVTGKSDKIILATVKGDIHDIGKSIVRALLENYGYDIIDLGRDVPPETVLEAAKKHECRLVGLSALMTTTLGAMEETVKLLKRELPECRIMVGGAVLTPEYADVIGADFYAKDAKGAVDIAKKVFNS